MENFDDVKVGDAVLEYRYRGAIPDLRIVADVTKAHFRLKGGLQYKFRKSSGWRAGLDRWAVHYVGKATPERMEQLNIARALAKAIDRVSALSKRMESISALADPATINTACDAIEAAIEAATKPTHG